jgi:hypothetical protein
MATPVLSPQTRRGEVLQLSRESQEAKDLMGEVNGMKRVGRVLGPLYWNTACKNNAIGTSNESFGLRPPLLRGVGGSNSDSKGSTL